MIVIARTRRALAACLLSFACWLPSRAPACEDHVPAPEETAAHAARVLREGVPQLEVRLLIRHEPADPAAEGARGAVGVLFDLAPGWHLYWRSAGDTGLPPELEWQMPGAELGDAAWPAPKLFERALDAGEPSRSYGYEGQVLLARPFRLAGPTEPGARVAVEGDVLICEAECVPAAFQLERGMAAALPGLSRDAEMELFERHAARVPVQPGQLEVELASHYSRTTVRPGDTFEAALEVRSASWEPVPGAAFFPDDSDSLAVRVEGVDGPYVSLSGSADPEESEVPDRLTGVLALRGPGGEPSFVEVDVPFPGAPADADSSSLGAYWRAQARPAPGGSGLLGALLLGLLGGLVLNLMPCVLPVLAIKVFSISELAEAARSGRGEVLRQGLAYTLGIVGSMVMLASGVLVLRSAGHAVGWGFQFQEPLYIAAISAVLVAFAANLFGAFEIPALGMGGLDSLGQQATGARRSFFEGLLAVALATPCSAPFLGTAVGFAFASEPAVIVAVFVAVGLGLAAPFLLITWVPGWARFLPRPGAWMGVVRTGLGFSLLATVVWLLWIFGGSAGLDGSVALLGFLLALAFGLWCYGLLQRTDQPRTAFAAGVAVILLAVAGLNGVGARAEASAGAAAGAAADPGGASHEAAWSPAAVDAALAAGRPVFVRFTADWCITCKVNERVVLADDSVLRALDEGGFDVLVGDWTHRDEAIRVELARHGRAGVPLYLVYHPRRPDSPLLLPEILTVDLVLAAVGDPGHPQNPQSARTSRR